MNLIKHLKKLIKDAHYWEYTNILKESNKPILYFNSLQWFFIFTSLILLCCTNNIVNEKFVGYIMAVLSIFVALLLTLIFTIYDKFQNIDFSIKGTKRQNAINKKKIGFFEQFNALTTYAILIALLCIVLFLLTFIFSFLNSQINLVEIINDCKNINEQNILLIIKYIIIIFHRTLSIYFLLDFFLMLLYSITSMYSFISNEYSKVEIPEGQNPFNEEKDEE